jgi:23S rRNA (cytosine1962-C5)-methyltransferase
MWNADNWRDYELLDTSDGQRLERWGKYILIRPDPQVVWNNVKLHPAWKKADAVYTRSETGGGSWDKNKLPGDWLVGYNNLKFLIRPTGFKHTGLFPEQACNWDWMTDLIKKIKNKHVKVLNLFAYTGGATVAAAAAGAEVCHVDAAKGMVSQAKINAELSGLKDAPIRYIVDDCIKFTEREIKRGNRYDAVIMDPPSYGRGPNGEIWKIEYQLCDLIKSAVSVLNENPLFFLVNSYTTGISPSAVGYMLSLFIKNRYGGVVVSDDIGLRVTQTGYYLPCGSSARWSADN